MKQKIKDITKAEVQDAFNRDDLIVFTNSNKLEKYLETAKTKNQNILLMSSGNFNGINFENYVKKRFYLASLLGTYFLKITLQF